MDPPRALGSRGVWAGLRTVGLTKRFKGLFYALLRVLGFWVLFRVLGFQRVLEGCWVFKRRDLRLEDLRALRASRGSGFCLSALGV